MSKLSYGERGSQTYASLAHAKTKVKGLRSVGIDCQLWESEPVVWNLIDDGPKRDDPMFHIFD